MAKNSTRKQDKYTAKYWNSEITSATDRHKKFWESGQESINVYNTKHLLKDLGQDSRRLNCWWYLVQTLLPAYYSSTPKAEVNLRKRAGGIIYELASTGLERNVQYAMDEYFDFDMVGLNAALQFLLVGRAVLWARYDADIEDDETTFSLLRDESGQLVDINGQPYQGEDPVSENEGQITATRQIQKKVDERAILDLVQYNDYLESDGRNESEIEWRSRRAYLSEDEAKEMFGSEVADKLSYDSYPELVKKERYKEKNNYDGKAELQEIWCEESGKVYWIQAKGEKTVIESGPPTLKFEDFYPCEVINSSIDPDSTIPTSDYVHCRDQIIEVERLTTRIHAVTLAIRTNGFYDATLQGIEDVTKGDLKLIPIKSWPAYKSRGGLSAGMEMMNIDPYVNALGVLTQARETALQKLYETTKASDLLRGVSDPSKTATANRLENQWSSLGLIVRQNQFAKFIGKAIGKLGAVIAQQFSPEKIFEVGDMDSLIYESLPTPPTQDPNNPQPQMDPQMQVEQIKEEIIGIYRDNIERCYRIQIASDSMVALDEKQERDDGVTLMQSAGSFFDQMKSLIEQYPPLAPFSVKLFSNVIRRYRGGKELEPIFMDALHQVSELALQKQAQQANQPQDPKLVEAQTRMQIAQIDSQVRTQVAQLDSQDKHQQTLLSLEDMKQKQILASQEFQQRYAVEQMKQQADQAKVALDTWKAQQDVVLAQKELDIKANLAQIELLKVQASTDAAMANIEIDKENNRLSALLDAQRLQLEQMHYRLTATEKLMEEKRLAQVELGQKMEQAKPAATPAPQPVVIHNHIPASANKVVTSSVDAKGNKIYKTSDSKD